jgi:hypothetical protein
VVATVATKGQGLQEVKDALPQAKAGKMDPWLKEQLDLLTEETRHQGDALLILEEDPDVTATTEMPALWAGGKRFTCAAAAMVDRIISQVVTRRKGEAKASAPAWGSSWCGLWWESRPLLFSLWPCIISSAFLWPRWWWTLRRRW